MPPLAERVAAIEQSDKDGARRLDDIEAMIQRIEEGQQAILMKLSERRASEKLAAHFVEGIKLIIAMALGGAASAAITQHWFGGGALQR